MEQKRIPTLLGFAVILFSLAALVFGVTQYQNIRSRAGSNEKPSEIKITNVSDKGFSVSWTTVSPTVGFVNYGPTEELGINVEDDRRDSEKYSTHQVTVSGLAPTTKYYFKVGSGVSLVDQNGSPFEVTTASSNNSAKRDIISGFVMKNKTEPVPDALVVLTIKDSLPLSTITNQDGQYRLDLGQARDKTNLTQIDYSSSSEFIDIVVKSPGVGDATATTITGNSHPVPPIQVGEVNDFTKPPAKTPSSQGVVTVAPTSTAGTTSSSGVSSKSKDQLGVTGTNQTTSTPGTSGNGVSGSSKKALGL